MNWKQKRETPAGKAKYLINQAKNRAKKNGGTCDLDPDWLENILLYGRCIKTGIPFELKGVNKGSGRPHPYAPSLDRIDSNNPDYTYENVNVVVWSYNSALMSWDDEDIVLQLADGIRKVRNDNIHRRRFTDVQGSASLEEQVRSEDTVEEYA